MKTPLVSLRRVSVSYDGHDALKEVDLDIYPDDFLGIIGPNGGGKTTLVKAIVGTIPYRGTITYSPQLFRGKERLIGYMPQQSIFDRSFPISVLEVVMSGLQGQRGFHARYASGDRAKAQELLRTAGIDGIARKPIGEISGGQMQRALLCRAVISDPKLLILDEPATIRTSLPRSSFVITTALFSLFPTARCRIRCLHCTRTTVVHIPVRRNSPAFPVSIFTDEDYDRAKAMYDERMANYGSGEK